MYTDGYLKLSRRILDWRWYKDANTVRLFIHLMLKAFHTDAEFEKHTLRRGQLVATRKKLCEELDITEQEVRTALNHLKSTNDITIKTTSKYSIITMLNYDEFQTSTSKLTNNQPTANQQLTSNQPQYNKYKKDKKYNKARNNERNASYTLEQFEAKSMFND